jgi:hypothetical protein
MCSGAVVVVAGGAVVVGAVVVVVAGAVVAGAVVVVVAGAVVAGAVVVVAGGAVVVVAGGAVVVVAGGAVVVVASGVGAGELAGSESLLPVAHPGTSHPSRIMPVTRNFLLLKVAPFARSWVPRSRAHRSMIRR